MQENFEITNKENIQLNIKVRKIERSIHDAPKTRCLATDKSQTKETKWQVLKPEDLEFGNLPIQKLLPVPFVDCIESFSRIEESDNLIFTDFKMKKKWIEFLIYKIQNSDKNHDNLIFKQNQNETHLFIDISEIENNKIYNIYTFASNFRFIFSDQYTHASIICGFEYLFDHHGGTNASIPQKEIKKGLLNYIFKKWMN
jgi:hypothetical protein